MLLTGRNVYCLFPKDTSCQYCIIIVYGVEDNSHLVAWNGLELLSHMLYWYEFGRITFRFFCYSALIASGPLLLSPPSLPTSVHTLVSGIMCVIYAWRNSLLQAVLKFTYGNLVTQLSSHAVFLLFDTIFTTSQLISHCQYQIHRRVAKFMFNPEFKQLLCLLYLCHESHCNAWRSHFNKIPTSKLNISQNIYSRHCCRPA